MLKKSESVGSILFVGAGGHARSLIDIVTLISSIEEIAVIDPKFEAAFFPEFVKEFPESDLPNLVERFPSSVIGLGISKGLRYRISLCQRVRSLGYRLINIVHPTAYVSRMATLGQGVHIFAKSYIGPGAVLSNDVTVNTGAIVEHDAVIEEGSFICPGAIVCGAARVLPETIVKAGEIILPGVVPGRPHRC